MTKEVGMDRDEAERLYRELDEQVSGAKEEFARLSRLKQANEMIMTGLLKLYPDISNTPEPEPEPTTPSAPVVAVTSSETGTGSDRAAEPMEKRSLRSAVLDVLNEEPTNWWTTAELVGVLHDAGVLPVSAEPEAAVRAALRRLDRTGLAERVKADGRSYVYRATTPEAREQHARDDHEDFLNSMTPEQSLALYGEDGQGN